MAASRRSLPGCAWAVTADHGARGQTQAPRRILEPTPPGRLVGARQPRLRKLRDRDFVTANRDRAGPGRAAAMGAE